MFAVRFASILHVVDMFHLKKEVFIQLDKANLAVGDVKFSPEGLPDLVTTVWSVYPREPGVRTHPSSLSAFSPMNNCYRRKCELSIDYATCIMYVCLCVWRPFCDDFYYLLYGLTWCHGPFLHRHCWKIRWMCMSMFTGLENVLKLQVPVYKHILHTIRNCKQIVKFCVCVLKARQQTDRHRFPKPFRNTSRENKLQVCVCWGRWVGFLFHPPNKKIIGRR